MWQGYPAGKCSCRATHRPAPHRLNRHHALPQSWGGPTVLDNLIDLCPTAHVNVHMLIDLYTTGHGEVPPATLRTFSLLERRLAKWAWDQRPSDNPPLTSLVAPHGAH